MSRWASELRSLLSARFAGALALSALLAPLSASSQQLQFRHLGPADGLADPWVQAIVRDSRGFMWFGTTTGLNRYDGYTMQLYRPRAGDRTTLRNWTITALLEDRYGVLWVGTGQGLSRYDRARDRFTTFMAGDSPAEPSQEVRALLEDHSGRLWVVTSGGFFYFDRSTARSMWISLPYSVDPQQTATHCVTEDERGHIWVGTAHNGLFDFDPVTGRTRIYTAGAGPFGLPSNEVSAVVVAGPGRVWVATYGGGLVLFDNRQGVIARYRHDPRDPASLGADVVRNMIADGLGGLWLGLDNAGLDHFEPAAGRFDHTEADLNRPTGLAGNSVWALYQDPEGSLWAGTFSGGINVLTRSRRALRHYAFVPGDSTSISHNSVVAFAQDSSGAIWIGTDGGGLDRFDPATGRFRRYTTHNSNLDDDAVLAVAADPGGAIWVGTWQGGISRLDPRTGLFTAYTTRNSALPDNHIFSLRYDRAGRLWVGTWQKGLALFDATRRTVRRFVTQTEATPSQVWVLTELQDGRLLIGTISDGLLVLDPANGSMTRFSGQTHRPGQLSWPEIRAILETPEGIWIGTAADLELFDGTDRFWRPAVAKAIPSFVSGLARDRHGILWATTERGIARLDPRTGSARYFTPADGTSANFRPRSYFQSREGLIFFGGDDGFDVIQPDSLRLNPHQPPVVLTDFQLFNKPVRVGAPGSPLRRQISESRHVTLRHGQSVFTIGFAALDYAAPGKNQYAYKLEGFDREWTDAGTNRSATYTSLPAGEYTFHVKASNADGIWNEGGTSLRITILPPTWQTWWFRLLVALLVVGGGAAIALNVRRRRRALEAMNRRLEAMNQRLAAAAEHDHERQSYLESNVLEILRGLQQFAAGDFSVALQVNSDDPIGRLREGVNSVMADRKRAEEELRHSQKMEAVGRLAGGVAHDFNNLLTVIKGNTTLALAGVESADRLHDELLEVQRAAERAESLTRQLLAFSRKQILQPRVLSLNDVVRDMERMLQRSVGEDVQIRTVLQPALGNVRADRGQLEQVVLNLVVNARDAMPRGGILTIETDNVRHAEHVGRADDLPYVALIVRDTGSGMAPEVRERVFEPFFTTKEAGKGTGLGLATVYGIVSQSGGSVHVESEPGRGATFTVYLPRVEASEAADDEKPMEPPAEGSGTILLVEDEEALRRLAARVLDRSGYSVLSAASGYEALELAGKHTGPIHLLLTDVVMPGMSGRELAELMVPRHPGMRLLYTSGYTEDDIVRHGVSGQGTAFLEKPFTPADLLRKVREVLMEQAPGTVAAG